MAKNKTDKVKIEKVNKEKITKTNNNETDLLLKTIENQKKTIENLENKNSTHENSLELMQKQFAEMQSALIKLQSNGNQYQNVTSSSNMVSLGCRFINGVTLYSPKREIDIRVPYGENIEITEDEMQMLMKTGFVRDFLKKNVIYFTDEENYKKFKIFDRYDLSDEKIAGIILNSNSNKLVVELNKYTNEKKDDPVFHSLFYRIVDLYNKGKLTTMSYEVRKTIETYFKFDIVNAQMLLYRLEAVR
jgi:hypothetical protein